MADVHTQIILSGRKLLTFTSRDLLLGFTLQASNLRLTATGLCVSIHVAKYNGVVGDGGAKFSIAKHKALDEGQKREIWKR